MQLTTELKNKLEDLKIAQDIESMPKDSISPPQNWKHITGDLKKILDENSEEFVVFDKELSTPDQNSKPKTNDEHYMAYNQLARIMLATHNVFYDVGLNSFTIKPKQENANGQVDDVPPRKILCLHLFFGDGKARNNSYITSTSSVANYRVYGNSNEKWLHDFEVYPTTLENRFNQVLYREGALCCWGERVYMLGNVHPYFIDSLFEKLVENKVLTEEEAQFFQPLCHTRKPSSVEALLNEKINNALVEKKYDEALVYCRQIHDLHKEDPRNAKKAPCYQWDYSGAAFELAEILEPISPTHAIKALKIFEEYAINKGPNSPFQHKALLKMFDIYFGLCGSSKDEEAIREYRSQAIKTVAILIDECEDETEENYLYTQFINLLESHCGNHPHDTKSCILKNANEGVGFQKRKSDFNIMLRMANTLYALNKLKSRENQIEDINSGNITPNFTSKTNSKTTPKKTPTIILSIQKTEGKTPVKTMNEGANLSGSKR